MVQKSQYCSNWLLTEWSDKLTKRVAQMIDFLYYDIMSTTEKGA